MPGKKPPVVHREHRLDVSHPAPGLIDVGNVPRDSPKKIALVPPKGQKFSAHGGRRAGRVLRINWGRPAFASPARSRTSSGEPPVLLCGVRDRVQQVGERAPGRPASGGRPGRPVAQRSAGS